MPAPQNVEPRDARCFQPSSFATRKAQADADKATLARRRLVSLGESTFPQRNLNTGELEAFDVELYADLDHPINRYVKFPGQTGLTPLQHDAAAAEQVTRHTLKRPLGRPQVSAYTDTQLDDEPRRQA